MYRTDNVLNPCINKRMINFRNSIECQKAGTAQGVRRDTLRIPPREHSVHESMV